MRRNRGKHGEQHRISRHSQSGFPETLNQRSHDSGNGARPDQVVGTAVFSKLSPSQREKRAGREDHWDHQASPCHQLQIVIVSLADSVPRLGGLVNRDRDARRVIEDFSLTGTGAGTFGAERHDVRIQGVQQRGRHRHQLQEQRARRKGTRGIGEPGALVERVCGSRRPWPARPRQTQQVPRPTGTRHL